MSTKTKPQGFTVERFAEFWADPLNADDGDELADEVVGHWPGRGEPVRGLADYRAALGALLALVPDLSLSVAEHAENGEHVFIRWIATGTGANGPFELTGIDRIHVVDGQVKENYIRFDSREMEQMIGSELPA